MLALVLKAPVVPLQLAGPVPHRDPETGEISDAMKAALRGDWAEVDRIEIDYLNLLVRIGAFGVRYPDGMPFEFFHPDTARRAGELQPFVLTILRQAGPDGRSLLVWTLAEPCRRCAGLLRRHPCHVCSGRWYVGDEFEWLVYSDLDGILVRDDLDGGRS